MPDSRPFQEICRAFSKLLADSSEPNQRLQQEEAREEEEFGYAEVPGIRDVDTISFTEASFHVSVLIGYLGIAFKFAERDYVSKVNVLAEVSKNTTLQSLIELYIKDDCMKGGGSHSRDFLSERKASP